jgi:hypothetical protein
MERIDFMKVYVLYDGRDIFDDVIGVFSTIEKAKENAINYINTKIEDKYMRKYCLEDIENSINENGFYGEISCKAYTMDEIKIIYPN